MLTTIAMIYLVAFLVLLTMFVMAWSRGQLSSQVFGDGSERSASTSDRTTAHARGDAGRSTLWG